MTIERSRHVFGEIEILIESPCADDADDLVRDAEKAGDADRAYWAHVWPTAITLGSFVARTGLIGPGMRVLEIGCGVGLVGLVAARRGAIVTLTDFRDEAVAAATRNAELNNLHVSAARFDWREAPDPSWRPDLLLGADVLYSTDAHRPIARLIGALGCTAIVGFPNRSGAGGAIEALREQGLRVWDAAAETGRVLLAQRE